MIFSLLVYTTGGQDAHSNNRSVGEKIGRQHQALQECISVKFCLFVLLEKLQPNRFELLGNSKLTDEYCMRPENTW